MKIKLPGSEMVDIAVDEVVMRLSESPKVDAVAFTGSVAFGFLDEHSDIDMICFVNSYPTVEERRGILGPQEYSSMADTVYQETYTVDGTEIDIQFRDRKWFEDVLANPEMASDFNEKYVLYMLQNLVPAYDGKGVIKSLKERAQYTDKFAKRKIESSLHVLQGAKGEVEKLMSRSDVTFLDRTFSDIVEKYMSVIFAMNRLYFSDVKWGIQKLEKMDARPNNAIDDLKEFCTIGNSLDGIAYKTKMLRRMLLELSDIAAKNGCKPDISQATAAIGRW